ncbi:MAG: HD domain-containing protein [Clostridia bacterium]|nr:HD domain-containing protein [Clostridia bacterium]
MTAAMQILKKLEDSGKEGYLVGGCVRDLLLDKVPHDYDITTNALPGEIKEIFSDFRVIETGIQHGTLTVLCEDQPFEVTTYRTDGLYSDGRHPDQVIFSTSIKEDLKRRDFTINAMAMDMAGIIIDPYGGREDLKSGIIRAVGDPEERFTEDALRILRALRFSSVLQFRIEKRTADAAKRLCSRLKHVSKERCFSEIKKTVCGKGIREVLCTFPEIFAEVVPEISQMISFDQNNPHHCHDLLTHTALAIEAAPADPALRIAALFHDIGKPFTQVTDAEGISHYYGHASKSREIAQRALQELKADRALTEKVLFLVSHHDSPAETSKEQVAKRLRRHGIECYRQLVALRRADNMGQAPEYHRTALHDQCLSWVEELKEEGRCLSLRTLDINGNDLIALGFEKGPAIGKMLEEILELVSEGKLPNSRDLLLEYASSSK